MLDPNASIYLWLLADMMPEVFHFLDMPSLIAVSRAARSAPVWPPDMIFLIIASVGIYFV
jgi:hypothetical protein